MFEPGFWVSLVEIIFVNILLSGDNAVVIALASRSLPPQQMRAAIVAGSAVAVILRVIFTVFVAYLMTVPYLQLVGSVLLLYVAVNLINEDEGGEDGIAGAFDHGVGLAGERGFADQGHAIGHASVDGDALAGADEDLVARRDAIDGDAFAVAGGVDAFAKIEGGADFFDGTAEGIAALSGEDRAERVNGDEDGDDLVVDGAGRGERAMHGGKECAEDAEEKELLEDDASVAEGVPRFAQDGETSEKKNTEGGEGEGAVDDPAGLAGDGREVDGEAEDHGLRGEKPGHAEAEPVARLVVEDGLIGCVVAGAVAAG